MICLQWTIPVVVTHNFAQNAFLIYAGFSASNGGHFPVYSAAFLPFFERKFDAYLRQICLFDAYLRRSGEFMCQMTVAEVARKLCRENRGPFQRHLGGKNRSALVLTARLCDNPGQPCGKVPFLRGL